MHALRELGLSCNEIERRTGFMRRIVATGRALFHEIQSQGYEGCYAHLLRLLAGWRRAEKQTSSDFATSPVRLEIARDPQTGHAISPVSAALLCGKPRDILTPDQARKGDALKAGHPPSPRCEASQRAPRVSFADDSLARCMHGSTTPSALTSLRSCDLREGCTATAMLCAIPLNYLGTTARPKGRSTG